MVRVGDLGRNLSSGGGVRSVEDAGTERILLLIVTPKMGRRWLDISVFCHRTDPLQWHGHESRNHCRYRYHGE